LNKKKVAVSRFEEGFSCSQAIFSTYGEELGLDYEAALKIAGAFGGGIGRMAETCGVVTGALMAIGLEYGAVEAEDQAAKDKTYEVAGEFVKRFKTRHGSIICKELLGHDISTPSGVEAAREKGVFSTICPGLVEDAAEIIEAVLELDNVQ
jgi:C_GCAxxG_C_C family probable redox protein